MTHFFHLLFLVGLVSFSSSTFATSPDEIEVAAGQGDADAQSHLAFLYNLGYGGVEQSYELARYWWTKSAEQGNPYAQSHLVEMYLKGKGNIKQNEELAQYWIEHIVRAAGQEDAKAQFVLARLYFLGRGVNRDKKLAWTLLEKSEGGDALSTFKEWKLWEKIDLYSIPAQEE